MFFRLNLFFIFFIFLGCKDNDEKNLILPMPPSAQVHYTEPLEYLNYLRVSSNLFKFTKNEILEKTANNHSLYLSYNKYSGHDQNPKKPKFTGLNPVLRAYNEGYFSNVSENIAFKKDYIEAIDSLFTAIYHRFSLLSFYENEVGFSLNNINDFPSAVFVSGNSNVNKICTNKSLRPTSGYYKGVCKDEKKMIREYDFKRARELTSSRFSLFPFENAKQIPNYFSGESPDPMPSCKITANPISVYFNPQEEDIEILDFRIFKEKDEIKNTKIITHENDVNSKFTKNQFALFPLNVFDFNANYEVVFQYIQKNIKKEIHWKFKTKTPKNPYFVARNKQNLSIKPNEIYDIFVYPENCNDVFENYNIRHPKNSQIQINSNGVNSLQVKMNGYKGQSARILLNNKKEIKLILSQSSKELKTKSKKHLIIGLIILALAVFIGIFRRKK